MKKRIGIVSGLLTLCLAIAFPTTALAHRIYEGWIDVWSNGPKCLNEKITQDHGDTSWGYYPNGFWMTEGKAEKETTTPFGTISCNQNWDRPPGYLKSRVRIMKWVSGAWALCSDSGFIQSNVTTPQWNVKAKGSTVASDNPPCGDGTYTIIGNASIKENGSWVGGQLATSESEYLD